MSDYEKVDFSGSVAPWVQHGAFNTYWQYSYLTRAAFYANIRPQYRDYMTRWVQNALWWYDGWVPYFHSTTEGIFSTRIASALVNGAAKKVIGGRIFYKNVNKEKNNRGEINSALNFISSEWSVNTQFPCTIKRATEFAAAAGTSLIKINRDNDGLWTEALRFDSFYPVVGARGKLLEVYCFLRNFVNLASKDNKNSYTSFYVVEHRYFGDYRHLDGRITKNAPLCCYEIRRSEGMATSGQDYNIQSGIKIEFSRLPKSVRSDIGKAYAGIRFDEPIIMPFDDHLGAVLVNWTDGVASIPELPFGDSMLTNIIPYLQSYDFYFSAFNTDMYLGRGQVLIPAFMQKRGAEGEAPGGYYSGKRGFAFTKIPNSPNPENDKPTPIQFELRASDWKEIRDMLMQNIAINTRMNISTIASFLQDNTAQRTAREISTEESETALFVDDKREIIERPINEILRLVLRFYGYVDDVVIRWSQAGLSNVYTRTDMIATAVNGGFCSKYRAIQMFDQDDDEYQIAEEYERCKADEKDRYAGAGSGFFNDSDYFGGEPRQNPQEDGDDEWTQKPTQETN